MLFECCEHSEDIPSQLYVVVWLDIAVAVDIACGIFIGRCCDHTENNTSLHDIVGGINSAIAGHIACNNYGKAIDNVAVSVLECELVSRGNISAGLLNAFGIDDLYVILRVKQLSIF